MYSPNVIRCSRHLNSTFLGLDGCFKPKLKNRGIDDPDLGTGLAYMVNDEDYAAHLEATAGAAADKSVSVHTLFLVLTPTLTFAECTTCGSNLHAVNDAYTRNSSGYIVTGVLALSCRHSAVRPTSVVDLQKGEKYVALTCAYIIYVVAHHAVGI